MNSRRSTSDNQPDHDAPADLAATLPDAVAIASGRRRRRRSGFLTLVDQAALSGGSLFATLLVRRATGEEGLGIYFIGFPVLIVLMTILAAAVTLPYSILVQRMERDRAATWLGSAWIAQLGLLLIASAAMSIAAIVIGRQLGNEAGAIALSVVAAGAAMWLRDFLRRVTLADFRGFSALTIDLVAATLHIAALLWLRQRGELTVANAFLATAFGHACGTIVGLVLPGPSVRFDRGRIMADLREGWRFGRLSLVAALAGTLQGWSINWIVVAVTSIAVNGRFAEAMTIPLLINPLSLGLAAYLSPAYSRDLQESGFDTLRRDVTRHVLGLGLFGAIFLVLVGVAGVPLLERLYDHSAPNLAWWTVMALTLPSIVQRLTLLPVEAALLAENRPSVLMQSNLIGLGITSIGVAILTPIYGEFGAALAVLIGTAFGELRKVIAFLSSETGRGLRRTNGSASTSVPRRAERSTQEASSSRTTLPNAEPNSSSVSVLRSLGTPFASNGISSGMSSRIDRSGASSVIPSLAIAGSVAVAGELSGRPGSLPRNTVTRPYWHDDEAESERREAEESARRRRLNWLLICIWITVLATFSPPGRDGTVTAESLDIVAKLKLVTRLLSTFIIMLLVFDRDSWRRNAWLQSVFLPMAAFLAWGAASVTWSAIPSISVGQVMSFAVAAGLGYVAAANVRGEGEISRVFFHLSAATSMVSVVLLTAHFGFPETGRLSREMVTGYMHPTSVASTAAVGLLVTLAGAMIWRWNWALKALFVVVPLQLLMLIVAENRMSLLMLIPAGGGLIVSRISRRRLLTGTAIGSAVVLAYLLVDPGLSLIDLVLGGTTDFASRGQTSDEIGSFSGRFEMWSVQWASFLQSPWIGHGYFVTSRSGELYVWYTFSNWTAHDIWLQVLVTTGVVGFGLFLWLLFSWIGRIVSAGRRRSDLPNVLPTLGWIFLWYLGWSSINESVSGPLVPESIVFFLLCGIGLSLAAPTLDEEDEARLAAENDPMERRRSAFLGPKPGGSTPSTAAIGSLVTETSR